VLVIKPEEIEAMVKEKVDYDVGSDVNVLEQVLVDLVHLHLVHAGTKDALEDC
jgi:hypothetical protein